MTKPGRPKADIDWEKVDRRLEAQCTAKDIAEEQGLSVSTLRKRCMEDKKVNFSAYCQQKRQAGKNLLRVAQFKAMMDGNSTMLIWGGKQYLGQSDKTQAEITGPNRGPLVITWDDGGDNN